MSIKLALHVHSESRGRTFINAKELRKSLKQNSLDGAAITNFFNISHALWLKEKLKEYVIIVGQEIWSKDGHIIGLGLKERISDFCSAEETVNCIHEQGGIVIAPHPHAFLGIKDMLSSLPIDALETYNALIGPYIVQNYLAKRTAEKMNIPQVTGTDTSDPRFVGQSYTEVFVEDSNLALEGIRLGNVRLHRRALPVPLTFIFKNIFKFRNLEVCSIHGTPCFICGKSVVVRLFKERFNCVDCGKVKFSHIVCCNGHYLCVECLVKRGVAASEKCTASLL